MKTEISRGAESIIYLDKNIIKDRISKTYRIKEIDEKLRKSRTRREAKILKKLEEINFTAPRLIDCDNLKVIEMEYIEGSVVKDILEKKDYINICNEIGKKTKILHDNNIMHGDLTTSNMILKDDTVYFIDFGLSFFSDKVEDRAVDLHLIKQALESKHYTIWDKCFDAILKGYNDKEVIKRLEIVEGRGRNKNK